jgi:outer membrane protein TolC
MQKASKQDSQRPNERGYLSFPIVSLLTPKVLGIFTAVLGTACTFALTSEPQQIPEPTATAERATRPSMVEPTASQAVTNNLSHSDRQIKKEAAVFPGLQSRTTLKRSLQQQNNPAPSLQVTDGLQTFSKLAFLSAVALRSAQTPQNQQAQVISQASLSERQASAQTVETRSKQINTESVRQMPPVKLALSDIVILALENNRPIKNAYLERIAQRQDLAVAESKFSPTFTPSVSVSLARFGSNRATNADVGLEANVRIPTGGELSFRWAANGQTLNSNGFLLSPNDDGFGSNLEISFNQPLLRGAGVNVNRASIDIARLTEQVNILDLKTALSDTITDAIVAYREFLRSQERLKIAQISLKSAQDFLEINRFLIEVGRLAPVDIVQSETDVANRQVNLTDAENRLDAARLALLNILDLDRDLAIVAAETPTASRVYLNSSNLMQLAFENRPEYLKALLNIDRTRLALLQTANNRLWDLSLNTTLSNSDINPTDVRTGLILRQKLGDLTVERDFQRSRVDQLQAENTLQQQRKSLEIQVTDNIRNVSLTFAQVELARKATALSESQLEIAREKQKLGRPISVFELVRLQNDLEQARNTELNATIDYLNALTSLDRTLGTTLDTWQVTIEQKAGIERTSESKSLLKISGAGAK